MNPEKKKELKLLPDWKNFLTGAVSGAISRTVTNPLERLRILRQLQIEDYKSLNVFRAMVHMGKSEGFYGFFKGNGVNVLRIAPFVACQFYFYELFKGLIFRGDTKNVYLTKLICGGLSGMVTSVLTYPLDLIRTFFNIQTAAHKSEKVVKTKPSIISAAVNIYKESGFFGLYKGLLMTWIGIIPLIAIKLSVFDWSITKLHVTKEDKWFDVWNSVVGAFAGVCAIIGVYPTDVIRRFMQVRGLDSSGIESKGMLGCIANMYKRGGLSAFYRGLSASIMKEIPSSALMFMVNERMKKLLQVI